MKRAYGIFALVCFLISGLGAVEGSKADVVVSNAAELADAVVQANSGGDPVILLQDGTYALDDMLWVEAENVSVRSVSGDRDTVVIQGQGMSGGVSHVFNVAGSGFSVEDVTLRDVANHAVQLQPGVDNAVIRNVHVLDTGEQMIKVAYDEGDLSLSSDNGLVESCRFEYSAGVGPQWYIGGVDAHNAKNWVVRGNVFRSIRSPGEDVAEHAIHFWSGSEGTLIEGNTIVNCDRGIGLGLGDRGHVGGIVRNNMIYHDAGEGFADVGIGAESTTGASIVNNTVFMEHGYPNAIECRFAATSGVTVANNLTNRAIVERDGASATFSSNVTDAEAGWFVHPPSGDLHLASAVASVVDQGESLTEVTEDFDGQARPQGSGWDVGADEYSSGEEPFPDPDPEPSPSPGPVPEGDNIVVDSTDPQVTVQLEPSRLVDLYFPAEEGARIWIAIQASDLFPGVEFARPNDAFCNEQGRYVFPFSTQGQFTPEAGQYYYLEECSVSKIHFGANNLNGLGTLVISIYKGELAGGLEPLQVITLLPAQEPPAPSDRPTPPDSPVKLVFIHHSCGENWLSDESGGLGLALRDNNYFVSDTNYGWGPDSIGDSTDIGHWYTWFRGPNRDTYVSALYAESEQNGWYSRMAADPGGENEIVMFKSCYPNSYLEGAPGDPPVTGDNPLRGEDCGSEHMRVGNAKGVYLDLLDYFATRQDKLFIVVTAPPLSASETDASIAANARGLNDWLVNDYLDAYAHNNVAVFDFFNVLTSNGGSPEVNDAGQESGNHHRWWNGGVQHVQNDSGDTAAYPSDEWDSHPTAAGNQKATAEFTDLLNAYYHCWQGTGACP